MMLFKRRKLVKTLHQLIAQVTSDLPPDDIQFAHEYMEAGEWALALDQICTQLYEYQISISAETFQLIETAARLMELPDDEWLYVKELVKSPL